MSSYIVAYDLYQSGQNYDCIIKKLEAYPTHWHMQQSVWVIETMQSASDVRDNLLSCLDANDKIFVGSLSGAAAWYGYGDKINKWVKEHV